MYSITLAFESLESSSRQCCSSINFTPSSHAQWKLCIFVDLEEKKVTFSIYDIKQNVTGFEQVSVTKEIITVYTTKGVQGGTSKH